nr:20S proteasome beta subunit PBC1 [Arabidopsis thaliana]CAA73616.1 multicatalytic endopeptidase [Arabidopsis thaliana]
MSIFEYNGSAVVAMVGKNCFAIASDRRLGVQLQTIATDFQNLQDPRSCLHRSFWSRHRCSNTIPALGVSS